MLALLAKKGAELVYGRHSLQQLAIAFLANKVLRIDPRERLHILESLGIDALQYRRIKKLGVCAAHVKSPAKSGSIRQPDRMNRRF
jgi:hypothetical protein